MIHLIKKHFQVLRPRPHLHLNIVTESIFKKRAGHHKIYIQIFTLKTQLNFDINFGPITDIQVPKPRPQIFQNNSKILL
jgi:hypothetical protein